MKRLVSELNVVSQNSRVPAIMGFVLVAIWALFIIITGILEEKTIAYYIGGLVLIVFVLLLALALHPRVYGPYGWYLSPSVKLIDYVYDEGTSLLFKHKGKSVRVNLMDVQSIRAQLPIKDVTMEVKNARPLRRHLLILNLRCKTEFGDQIAFLSDIDRIKGGYSKNLQDLINRIEKQNRM